MVKQHRGKDKKALAHRYRTLLSSHRTPSSATAAATTATIVATDSDNTVSAGLATVSPREPTVAEEGLGTDDMSDGDAKRTTEDETCDDVNPSSGAGGDGHPIIALPPPPVTTDSDKIAPTELIAVSPREPAASDEGLSADNMSDGNVKRTTGDGTPDDVNPSSGAGGEGHPIIAQPPPPEAAVITGPPPPDATVPDTPVPKATEPPEVDRVPTEAEALQILEARHRAFSAQVSIISRSPEPDLEGLRKFLGGVSMARVATFVAHAQATDPSMFGSSDSTVLPQDPDAMFTLNCAVMCHSVLWASEDAVLAGRGEWTPGKVIGTFDDGSSGYPPRNGRPRWEHARARAQPRLSTRDPRRGGSDRRANGHTPSGRCTSGTSGTLTYT